jgi:adenylate kinase family enzyme
VTGKRIHLVGASGAGTTTLGAALAKRLGCPHFDTDDYFWLPTVPKFEKKRDLPVRQALLGSDLEHHPAWVLSGSLCGWGDVFIPHFDLVVFLAVPDAVRLARLHARELERYGAAAIAPGGAMRERYEAFMAWAASYETGPAIERSRSMHETWLAALPCPVLRLEDTDDVEIRLARVLAA